MATKHPLTFTVTNEQIVNVDMKSKYGKTHITTGDKVYIFSDFCGTLRLEGIENLEGRAQVRSSEMEKWSEHRVVNDPTIALACAVINGIKKIKLGVFDEHPVVLVVKDTVSVQPQAAAQSASVSMSKERLHAVIDRIGAGVNSGIYMRARGQRLHMSLQEAHAWLERGAIDEMEVRVSIGSVETFLPLLQVAPMIEVNPVQTSASDLVAALFGAFITHTLRR